MVIDMRILIIHEIKRFFKNRKNIMVMGLFLFLTIAMFFYNTYQGSMHMKDVGRGYFNQGRQSSSIAASLNSILEELGQVEGESPEFTQSRIDYFTQEAKYLSSIGHFYEQNKEKDYKYINIVKRDLFSYMLEGYEDGIITIEEVQRRGYTPESLFHLSQYTNHLVDMDIQPMLNVYNIDAANGMVMFLGGGNLTILMFLIAMIIVDIYLKEIMDRSYKISFTQPYERKQIFLSKAIVITMISIGLILFSAAFNFILYGTMGGLGNWQYPMMSKESLMGLSLNSLASDLLILPLWKYLLMGFVLLIFLTLFMVIFILYISIRTDSNNQTIGITVIFLFMAFVFSMFLSEKSIINLWYPLSYLFVDKVISVTNRSNYIIGILLNGIGSTILFILSYNKFIKKDFLDPVE